jgi:hypothetical protein
MQSQQANACLQGRLHNMMKTDSSMIVSVNYVERLAGEPKARWANTVEAGEDREMEFGRESGEVVCSGLGFVGR